MNKLHHKILQSRELELRQLRNIFTVLSICMYSGLQLLLELFL
jgi:hypothetical protein